MRRFYVVPKALLTETIPGKNAPYHDLFISAGGHHHIELDGVHVLACCDDFKNVLDEQLWHAHPQVARLHNPATAPNAQMHELLLPKNAHKQFCQCHMDALKCIGVTEHCNVRRVSELASKIHPLVKLSDEY
jgi:hypothetical protein